MISKYLPYIITEIFCIAFSLDILLRLHRKRVDAARGTAELRRMIAAYIVMLITDIFWACVEDGTLWPEHYLNAFINAASLTAVAFGCYYWFCFVEARLGSNRCFHGRAGWLYELPLWVACAADMCSVFTNWVFYIDASGLYCEGRLFWLQGAITYAYLLIPTVHSILCAFQTDSRKTRGEYLSYAGYILVPAALIFIVDDVKPVPLFALSVFLVIQLLFLTLYLDQEYTLAKQERELADSRAAVMLSQIQPHFLYNTLVVIQSMCQEKAPEAAQTTVEFADFLRGNLDSLSRKEPVPFEQELRHTQIFLTLEQKRYGDHLQVEYDIRTTAFLLPALTLQPIAENAVQHGISEREEGGKLRITAEEREHAFTVTVEDDGVGFDPDTELQDGRSHIGITNVRERLDAMCGGTLTIRSEPGKGTTAVISVPKQPPL